jgi:hypothetical protein
VILNLCPPGFTFLGVNRPLTKSKGRGGGVGFLVRDSIPCEQETTTQRSETFESMVMKVKCTTLATIALIYRPPPSRENGHTIGSFLHEFEEYLSALLVAHPGKLYILGDFNFHMERLDDPNTRLFSTLLSTLGLKQHVHRPTHRAGGMLDLVITREENHPEIVHSVAVHHDRPSDHHIVSCVLCLLPPRASPRKANARSISRIQPQVLAEKLQEAL